MISDEKWHLCRMTTAPENADFAANWLLEHGCEGVQIEDTAIVFDQSEDATLVQREEVILTGYRRENSAETPEDLAAAAARELPFETDLVIEDVQSHDWANAWREDFPPLEIGPFLIVPSWENGGSANEGSANEGSANEGSANENSANETPENSAIPIVLDPGLAFGTGQHPTTRMCLELLGEWREELKNQPILDVGCGSGILSIAAAKLGARAVGSDLDEWCTIATRENAAANGVEVETHLKANLDWVETPFPFVIANLMSDLLIRLAPDLARVTQSGGALIVSGISSPRADEVQTALENAGFETKTARQRDGETREDGYTESWAAFVFRKTGEEAVSH